MLRHLALVSLVVADYDEAIRWYVDTLGFVLLEDTERGDGKRWVRVAPTPEATTALLLARAVTDGQRALVGRQAGGRVWLFLESDDCVTDHARLSAAGVRFREAPRHEDYGVVAVFEDLYGNPWDLIEHRVP